MRPRTTATEPYGEWGDHMCHSLLSAFPPKLPKTMTRDDFFCWRGSYAEGTLIGEFDQNKVYKKIFWFGEDERFVTDFKKKAKKMRKMGNKKNKSVPFDFYNHNDYLF
ncbi:unnamed protein product [Amoebophrya sp. A25]|nr:unnamed protein product [Amoebophrya sp. A25]|eukprot:GSA25T00019199001.1